MSRTHFNILVVDDDRSLLSTMEIILKDHGKISVANSVTQAREILQKQPMQLIFLDILLPDGNGLELLKEIKESHPATEVVMLTAIKEIDRAVDAIKNGAHDYLTKDFSPEEIHILIDKIHQKQRQQRELTFLRSEVAEMTNKEMILGDGPKSREIRELLAKVANLPASVLIEGESGTGKELLARAIHSQSPLREAPFITIHVASLPSNLVESALFGHEKGAFTGATQQRLGKLELADGGTLFLDEVGEIPEDTQIKLLRFLQEGEIERIGSNRTIKLNVRIIAATNRDLLQLVKQGGLRQDLFYRLNTIPIKLPPLRERREDITALVNLFLKRYCNNFGKNPMCLSNTALKTLIAYPWPGNIRELEHLVERLVAIHDKESIDELDIPLEYTLMGTEALDEIEQQAGKQANGDYLKTATAIFERNLIDKVLQKTGGNRTKTAKQLGIPLSTLKFKLQKLGIKKKHKELAE